MADGSVILTEIAGERITRVAPDGSKTHVADIRGPNGLAIGPDGALYVCDNGRRFTWPEQDGMIFPGPTPETHTGGSIERVDLATGEVTRLYDACDGRPLWAPNDIVFDADGGFWFTDHGRSDDEGTKHGGLYWAKADGSAIKRGRGHLHTPNGVGLSPDGKVVYVADTMSGKLIAFDIVGEGELAPPSLGAPGRVIATMPGHQLFDSLAVA